MPAIVDQAFVPAFFLGGPWHGEKKPICIREGKPPNTIAAQGRAAEEPEILAAVKHGRIPQVIEKVWGYRLWQKSDEFSADAETIYLCGSSDGTEFAEHLVCRYGWRLAEFLLRRDGLRQRGIDSYFSETVVAYVHEERHRGILTLVHWDAKVFIPSESLYDVPHEDALCLSEYSPRFAGECRVDFSEMRGVPELGSIGSGRDGLASFTVKGVGPLIYAGRDVLESRS